jgi:hypothetical protein
MRSTKLSSAIVAAAALLAIAPAGAFAAKHKGHASPAGCRLSESAAPHVVHNGDSVLVSGKLSCPGGVVGTPTVTLYERIAGVHGGFKLIMGPTPTAGDGSYAFTPPPVVADSTFYTRAVGARSANRAVRVAPQVSLGTSPLIPQESQLFTGRAHEVTFTGAVNPLDAGAEVKLERESGGTGEEWSVIQDHVFVKADGTFKIVHIFRVPGDANLQVIVRPHGRFDVRGVSNTLGYEISQTQNPNLTLEPSANPVNFGQPLTLKGIVKAGPGQKVILMARSFGSPFAEVTKTTSGALGAFEFKIASEEKNTFYRAVSGTVNSAVDFEGVKWVVTSSVSATKVTSGQEVTFSGTASPDRAGHKVFLEGRNGAGFDWHVVDSTKVILGTPTTGTFTIGHAIIGNGKKEYRIHIPGDPINQPASGAAFVMEVSPALSTVKPPLEPKLPQ